MLHSLTGGTRCTSPLSFVIEVIFAALIMDALGTAETAQDNLVITAKSVNIKGK